MEIDFQQMRMLLERERRMLLYKPGDMDVYREVLDNPDETDLADLYEERELQARLDELSASKLERIYRAMERLRGGTFGYCLKCRQPIPCERLQALPYAELCVGCQAKQEGVKGRVLGGGAEEK